MHPYNVWLSVLSCERYHL